ncbi:hypothetical protein D3OALGA1CA_672 [Olavius algarvensis associated proteobacterium Delta 3]|nr:hypothetical protein D3OALGA1CA_672 [Olavius algarvensis associated proteobacterium Delta 3]CAB5128615.1 hypothetical protein D3OALGB2SA_3457 [Olavius algarvensis associated proteobacterium Delta 3]
MRSRSKTFSIWIQLLCIHLSMCIANSTEVTPAPAADIPIFTEGYHVSRSLDPANQTVTVNYRVQAVHPAAEVLEFYDRYFNGRGWISPFETCQRNWQDIGGSKKPIEPAVRLLFASWEDVRSNQKVLLWIRHDSYSNQRSDEVVVEYQLRPLMTE